MVRSSLSLKLGQKFNIQFLIWVQGTVPGMEEYSNELKDGASAGLHQGFLVAQMVKKLPAMQETEIPWRREWQPTPVFMPGEYYGQRSLAGYIPWSHKELDMT